MKAAAMAILSVVLASIAYLVLYFGAMVTVWLPVALIAPGAVRVVALYLVCYLSAFLAGLILTRVKPFFMPAATVPLGIMAIYLIWAVLVLMEEGRSWLAPTWGMAAVRLGFLLSLGVTSLLGSRLATGASLRLAKFSVSCFQLAGGLAVLVCTSMVASVLRLTMDACQFAGNKMESDIQRICGFCLFAVLVIGAITTANLVLLFVRGYHKNESQVVLQR